MKKDNQDLLSTARDRLKMAIAAFSESREDELDDLRFFAASPDNQYQWPADVLGYPRCGARSDHQRTSLPDN
jgi:hypothetical protein